MESVAATPTVLIVEDDIELSSLYATWLQGSYEVLEAHTCRTAYSQFRKPVDVALLDRDLPDGTGDEVASAIREENLDWRIAFVTGREPTPEVLELEFDEYLCKPVDRERLVGVVDRLVALGRFGDVVDELHSLNNKKRLLHEGPAHGDRRAIEAIEDEVERLRRELRYVNEQVDLGGIDARRRT